VHNYAKSTDKPFDEVPFQYKIEHGKAFFMPIPIFLKVFYVPVPLTKTRSINKRWKTLNHKQKIGLGKKGKDKRKEWNKYKRWEIHKYKKGPLWQ